MAFWKDYDCERVVDTDPVLRRIHDDHDEAGGAHTTPLTGDQSAAAVTFCRLAAAAAAAASRC